MVAFPNCKINLGLYILDKRKDGFHNLQTIFFPVPLKDSLEIIHTNNLAQIDFSASGIPVDGDTNNNLCIKAYHLLKKDFPQLPAIKIHLHKAIPLGAGLGGGSADAAFTLQVLNKKFQLGISTEQLIAYGLELGSDCPFFIINKPCLATGRGEVLEEIAISLKGYRIMLVNPGIHVNTGWAFTQLNRQAATKKTFSQLTALKEIVGEPINNWKKRLVNDFEEPVFKAYPAIKTIKEDMYHNGAIYAAMSGSGSTVFGLFNQNEVPVLALPPSYFTQTMLL